MKSFLLLLPFLLLNSLVYGKDRITWYDLEVDSQVIVQEKIRIQLSEDQLLIIDSGTQLNTFEIIPLGMINVQLLRFDIIECDYTHLSSEMMIVSTESQVEIGVILEPSCRLEVYIENKDLMNQSIFSHK